MTTSNTKFRTGSKEAPTEPFKRAVTACLRAIAQKPELEVTFAAERPGLAPGKARLPEPARKMTKRDAAIVRGHADSIALKLACHDPKVHRKLMPGNPQARGVFEAVEQARVEAIGSRRMAGRCQEPHRDARRSFPSRQVRRDHRPRRRAVVGCAGDAGARAPDRAGAARGRQARWSTSGGRCWKTRSARGSTGSTALAEDQAQVRRRGARSVVARSISATTATPRPTRTRTRTTTATARTTSPAPKARPTATPRRK